MRFSSELDESMGMCLVAAEAGKGMGHSGLVTEEDLKRAVQLADVALQQKAANRTIGCEFLSQLLYGRDGGWLDTLHRHLRNMNAHKVEVQKSLTIWNGRGMKVLLRVLTSGTLYRDLNNKHLHAWFEKVIVVSRALILRVLSFYATAISQLPSSHSYFSYSLMQTISSSSCAAASPRESVSLASKPP
jgi:hypothetical protein